MRPAPRRPILTCAAALICLIAAVQPAGASSTQFTAMQDDGLLLSQDAAIRDKALDEMKLLGVDTVKVVMIWRGVAPNSEGSDKPAGFNGADPNAYGSGFGLHRALVDAIKARGMNVWLILNTPAPKWAAPKKTSPRAGVYKPSPSEFGDFSEAAGKAFPDVVIWSVLNEPNHRSFLQPQVEKTGVIASAVLYRNLFYESRAGLLAAGHSQEEILFGAMAPRAGAPKKGARSVQPIPFLRQFFCLDAKLKPAKGSLAKSLKCNKFKKIEAGGFAYHPYTNAKGPLAPLVSKDDAMIGQLPRLYKVLDRAGALKRLSKKRIKLWNAEFGYQTYPPDRCWTPIAKVPAFLNIAEYISWKDRRVANYHQYQLQDEPSPGLCSDPWQAGLRFINGDKKPSVYSAFEMPMVVEKVSRSKVRIWGGIRAFPGPGQTVEIQVKQGSGYTTVSTFLVTNPLGYFQTTVSLSGAQSKTWRIVWTDKTSRSSKPVDKIKPKR